jgi:hypothetical protein
MLQYHEAHADTGMDEIVMECPCGYASDETLPEKIPFDRNKKVSFKGKISEPKIKVDDPKLSTKKDKDNIKLDFLRTS